MCINMCIGEPCGSTDICKKCKNNPNRRKKNYEKNDLWIIYYILYMGW